jgi:NAD(P)-dependent dehydrogenase (short-subunit alcohol dehydrogenase family)
MTTEQMTRHVPERQRPIGEVLVTGAASGLGAAAADAVYAAGGTPIIVDVVEPDTDYESIVVDLGDTGATSAAIRRRAERGVDAVVTAAGIDVPGPLVDVDADVWERIVRVNLFGTVAVIRAALPSLIERRGRVVTVASTLGHRGVSDATAYCASKFGVVGFTRALTAELKGLVGVTMLTPGGMQTSFFDERDEKYKPGSDAQLCDPYDVASAIVFALSRPPGCEVKELVIAGPTETSWP